MPNIIEREMLSNLRSLHSDLVRQYDRILFLMNQSPSTVEADMHYATFRLAQAVATEFPSADQLLGWSQSYTSYNLPSPWQKDRQPEWKIEHPRLVADYDELLQARDALVLVTDSSEAYLTCHREFVVDSTRAIVWLEAKIPEEDVAILRALEKIQDEVVQSYTRPILAC